METFFLCICLALTGALLLLSIYFIITLSDLECDYLNPRECCDRLNICIVPRIITQFVLDVMYFVAGSYYLGFINILFTSWLVYQKFSIPKDSLGVYDPVEIHNRGQVKNSVRNSLCICGWYLGSFFCTMYMTILSVLKGGPVTLPDD